ncbi:MAG: (d)CMP kinase [Acidimicrobiia bacterium]
MDPDMSVGRSLVVAVDGPGGSGKSTVSRALGLRLGVPHLDTGSFYRAATLAALRSGIPLDDEEGVAAELDRHAFEPSGGRIHLDGEVVSAEVRGPEVTAAVSVVSAHPEVRRRLVGLQREWVASRGGTAVVEGRDIGAVVFPGATVKVYLTARPEVRARRRAEETSADAGRVAEELNRRDRLDSSRAVSPLAVAEDAVVIDTSDLGVDEVVERIVELVRASSSWR